MITARTLSHCFIIMLVITKALLWSAGYSLVFLHLRLELKKGRFSTSVDESVVVLKLNLIQCLDCIDQKLYTGKACR